MPTTAQPCTTPEARTIEDAKRAWDLQDGDAFAVMAFPFTCRRLPREARSHRA